MSVCLSDLRKVSVCSACDKPLLLLSLKVQSSITFLLVNECMNSAATVSKCQERFISAKVWNVTNQAIVKVNLIKTYNDNYLLYIIKF